MLKFYTVCMICKITTVLTCVNFDIKALKMAIECARLLSNTSTPQVGQLCEHTHTHTHTHRIRETAL